MRGVLLLYGIWNAVLYAGMLPLWDGFDEPFHYAYVQHLARFRTLPAPRATSISLEVAESLEMAPVSYVVKRNIPRAIAFDEYFAMPEERRTALRRQLESLDPRLALTERGGFNYEAHHA